MGITSEQMVIHLAEELGRHRALTDEESRMLERAIRRVQGNDPSPLLQNLRCVPWTERDDMLLLKAYRRGAARTVADTLGRSVLSVHSRMRQLRKRQQATTTVRKRARKMQEARV